MFRSPRRPGSADGRAGKKPRAHGPTHDPRAGPAGPVFVKCADKAFHSYYARSFSSFSIKLKKKITTFINELT